MPASVGRTVRCFKAKEQTVMKKRQYNEVLACFFCGKLLKMKMKRHLVSVHKDEPEVAKIMRLPDGKEQQKELARLRNRGNFNYNTNVLRAGKGDIICARKIKRTVSPRKYLPCSYCLRVFLAKDLHMLSERCSLRSEGDRMTNDDGNCKHVKNVKTGARFLLHGAVRADTAPVSTKFRTVVSR